MKIYYNYTDNISCTGRRQIIYLRLMSLKLYDTHTASSPSIGQPRLPASTLNNTTKYYAMEPQSQIQYYYRWGQCTAMASDVNKTKWVTAKCTGTQGQHGHIRPHPNPHLDPSPNHIPIPNPKHYH